MLRKFHLPGRSPLRHPLTRLPSGLSRPLGGFGVGQRSPLKGKGPGVNQTPHTLMSTFTHVRIHACTCTVTTRTLTRACTNVCHRHTPFWFLFEQERWLAILGAGATTAGAQQEGITCADMQKPIAGSQKRLRAVGFPLTYLFVLLRFHAQALRVHILL